jgi:hypothetical protein
MSDVVEKVAEAIDELFGYHIELVRLVDGVSTYELRFGGKTLEFDSHYEASLYLDGVRKREQAKAAIRATLEHYRDNVSDDVTYAGIDASAAGLYHDGIFSAMLSQAIRELD